MKALDKLRAATAFLKTSGIEDAERDAELIISHCIETDRAMLYRDNPGIPDDVVSIIDEFLERRSHREPVQYILGHVEFYGLKIKVGPGVLIPRPETELMVEEAIKRLSASSLLLSPQANPESFRDHPSSLRILDLCTGSGCIALALARAFPEAMVYGADKSEVALDYALKNAEINGIKSVTFLRGNLLEPLEALKYEVPELKFDLIISNPPYISAGDRSYLQPEIREWEPEEALYGGKDGLDYYRIIIPEARNYLKKNGFLIFELGIDQAAAVREMTVEAGFTDIVLKKDYAGTDRIFMAKRSG